MGDFADEKKIVTIPGHNGWEPKEISFKTLAYIIQARLEEIIDAIYFQIVKSGILDKSPQGIVLTGGTTRLVNLLQLVKFRTGLDARLGFSQVRYSGQADLDKASFLTALGLLQYSLRSANPVKKKPVQAGGRKGIHSSGIISSIGRMFTQQIDILFEDEDKKL
jgi:cell division protein FtsA